MPVKTPRTLVIVLATLLAIGGVAGGVILHSAGGDIPETLRGVVRSEPLPVESVTLRSAGGDVEFPPRGTPKQWTMLAIGFTHCPDVCPFLLANLAAVEVRMRETLPAKDLPRFAFLSVDPERDSADLLAEYVGYFSDRFVGLTGTRAAIDRFTERAGIFYRIGKKDAGGNYPVNHSGEIFLFDPAGRLFATFEPPLDPDRTSLQYGRILRFHDGRGT